MSTLQLSFPGSAGVTLGATLELPLDGVVNAYAIFAHCVTGAEDPTTAVNLSRAVAERGIAVLCFDVAEQESGPADFTAPAFTLAVENLVAAADFLARKYRGPQLLIGHSLGGAAALHAVERISTARAIVTINAPADPAQTRLHSRAALLIMHAPMDQVVGIHDAARIFEGARHPKSFIALDGADHQLSRERDSRWAGSVLAAWSERYLEAALAPPHDVNPEGSRIVARTGATGFRTEILAGGHSLTGDEPIPVGGTDTGPTPYDLLAAALGACTTMTLQMYARRKGWPLEDAIVRLRHQKGHAVDDAQCDQQPARLDRIERLVEVTGPLDDAQRARLLEIADRCPVHRTLEAGVTVETRLAGNPGPG